jgi:hypothetical protein
MKKIAFTPVLNGMPFIKKQFEFIPKVFDHWYIIEGVLNNQNDGRWNGNVITDQFVDNNFLSVDGTSEFLDNNKNDKVTIIRKNSPWNGYVEMANSFMDNVEDCILFYIDVDEFWEEKSINEISLFLTNNDINTLKFMCYYFVGKDRYVFEENKFGNNSFEWARAWKINQKIKFKTLQPPELYDRHQIKVMEKSETYKKGWVFTHYAYALEHQIIFKEKFHKHLNLLQNWNNLQSIPKGKNCLLSDYIPFNNSNTKLYYT